MRRPLLGWHPRPRDTLRNKQKCPRADFNRVYCIRPQRCLACNWEQYRRCERRAADLKDPHHEARILGVRPDDRYDIRTLCLDHASGSLKISILTHSRNSPHRAGCFFV